MTLFFFRRMFRRPLGLLLKLDEYFTRSSNCNLIVVCRHDENWDCTKKTKINRVIIIFLNNAKYQKLACFIKNCRSFSKPQNCLSTFSQRLINILKKFSLFQLSHSLSVYPSFSPVRLSLSLSFFLCLYRRLSGSSVPSRVFRLSRSSLFLSLSLSLSISFSVTFHPSDAAMSFERILKLVKIVKSKTQGFLFLRHASCGERERSLMVFPGAFADKSRRESCNEFRPFISCALFSRWIKIERNFERVSFTGERLNGKLQLAPKP